MPILDHGTYRRDPKSHTGRLYIPAALVRDSTFPLLEGDVKIEIENDHLIISKGS